jgi:hypothetical protein
MNGEGKNARSDGKPNKREKNGALLQGPLCTAAIMKNFVFITKE